MGGYNHFQIVSFCGCGLDIFIVFHAVNDGVCVLIVCGWLLIRYQTLSTADVVAPRTRFKLKIFPFCGEPVPHLINSLVRVQYALQNP